MYSISIKGELADLSIGKQAQYALRTAVNKTGKLVKIDIVQAMPEVFDRPTPWTLNSLMHLYATKESPESIVWVKDSAGKGTPASKYLLPEILGGERKTKRFERSLIFAGIMPDNMQAVIPSSASWAVQIDQYGNIKSSQIVQLLSYLQAFGEVGYRANMTDRRKSNIEKRQKIEGLATINGVAYFVARPGNRQRLHPGIWAKKGTHGVNIAPVLLFVTPSQYQKRLDFYGIADKTVAENFGREFKEAMVHVEHRFAMKESELQAGGQG